MAAANLSSRRVATRPSRRLSMLREGAERRNALAHGGYAHRHIIGSRDVRHVGGCVFCALRDPDLLRSPLRDRVRV